ncbi:zinc finger Ran-binding domain-containing protein [Streptomyces sp. NPDC008086]|uniref:zinc finger Ran-binding domain-containing protein n=1 Tax=Streptomyces sp. NPDC008086 TaxID=3364807 RepID=UPI0036E01DA4
MTGPTWQCSDCDTFNDATARVCDVCETPRRAATAPKAASGPTSAEPGRTPPRKSPPKRSPARTPPARKASAKKTPPAKKTAAAKKAATAKKATPAGKPPLRTGIDLVGARTSVAGLGWVCPTCGHRVAGYLTCDVCYTGWTPEATTTVRGRPLTGTTPRPSATPDYRRPTPREPTRGEVVAGCGCILFIAATVVTLVVLLILNWSTVTSFLTGADSSKGSATPSPTVSASGPCPKELAAMLPKGTAPGARLVAAYSRENVKDRYAFCRTKAGKVYYFMAKKTGASYGRPTVATRSGTGYLVRFPDSGFRFRDLELTAYDKDDKELWKEKLTAEATVG